MSQPVRAYVNQVDVRVVANLHVKLVVKLDVRYRARGHVR